MSKNFGCLLTTTGLVILLSGCITEIKKSSLHNKTGSNNNESLSYNQQIVTVPSLSINTKKINTAIKENNYEYNLIKYHYDWYSTIQNMIDKILLIQDINFHGILLINNIVNRTNGSLNVDAVTMMLYNILSKNTSFNLISMKKLKIAKCHLGLSPQDNFNTCNKAIGIARTIGAQYVIYSSIKGDINFPTLQIQLILVHSGEIIWSEESLVQLL